MKEMYFTIAGCNHYYGSDFMEKGIALKGVGEDYDLEFLKRYIVKGVMPRFSSTRGSKNFIINTI